MEERKRTTTEDSGPPKPQVFVGFPAYGLGLHPDILGAFIMASETGAVARMSCATYSLLCRNFNLLLAQALNDRVNGITHFLLWHSDVVPLTPNFLDKMLELMQKKEADVLSCIIPIKDETGITSTAWETDDPWRVKRMTLREAYDPRQNATFTDDKLLLNTGLMLIDIRRDWIEQCGFTMEDEIYKDGNEFKARGMSEDWLFSRKARKLGARLFATREIKIHHVGNVKFPNTSARGSKAHDD